MYQYPYLEQFYQENYLKLLDWSCPLRPSKSCPKNGAAGVAKFVDFYKKTQALSFTEDEVLKILSAENVSDGDTIFHQNLRVMRELKFVLYPDAGRKKYTFTEDFVDFVGSNHSVDYYMIKKLMSIASIDDLTMYFNFLICVMREAALYGQVIQYRDSADKFTLDVPDLQKRKEHQSRVYSVYGFKGDEARTVPENYTPNISYFCHAVLKQLGILTKSDVRIDNMGTLVLTPLGEIILSKINDNLQNGPQKQKRTIAIPTNLPLQQIFYGAPGTGKSHKVKEVTDSVAKDFVFRTTFHPDSDYSTFVGAYKPTMKQLPIFNQQTGAQIGVEDKIVYSFVPQAFLKAYVAVWKNPNETVFLVIEEINRGNCAQIFGDIFQLLDRKDGVSEYPIKADQDIRDYLAKEFAGYDLEANILSGEELVLPANLHIWATMNTSDQSLFPIDSAFKRRWDWKYMPIHDAGENWTIDLSDVEYDWWDFVEKINKVIGELTSSEDKKLGYFFCKACDKTIDAEKFVNKVVFYLWNDVFKDYELSAAAFKDGEEQLTFNKFYTPSGDADEATINKLMENLGVKKVGTEETEQSAE